MATTRVDGVKAPQARIKILCQNVTGANSNELRPWAVWSSQPWS